MATNTSSYDDETSSYMNHHQITLKSSCSGSREGDEYQATMQLDFGTKKFHSTSPNKMTDKHGVSKSRGQFNQYASLSRANSKSSVNLTTSTKTKSLNTGHGIFNGGITKKSADLNDHKKHLSNPSTPVISTRKRIPIACARCRKRKIRCSGETHIGARCINCRKAGIELCEFLRVSSQRAPMKSEVEGSLDFGSLSGTRNSLSCGASMSPYGFQSPIYMDPSSGIGSSVLGPNFASYRHGLIPPSHVRSMSIYDMETAYDLSESNIEYNMHAGPSTYGTSLAIDHQLTGTSYPSINHVRSWNPGLTANYARTPPIFPDMINAPLGSTPYHHVDHHTPNISSSPASYNLSQRCSMDNRNFSIQSLSPLLSSPSSPSLLLTNTMTGGSENERQLPMPLMNRSNSSYLRSNDTYPLLSSTRDIVDGEYSFPNSSLRSQAASGLVATTDHSTNDGNILENAYLTNHQDIVVTDISHDLPCSQIPYQSGHDLIMSQAHHSSDEHSLHSHESNPYSTDGDEATFSRVHTIDDSSVDTTDDDHQTYLSITNQVEKYSSPPGGICSLAQYSTGYPTPVSDRNQFSPPPS